MRLQYLQYNPAVPNSDCPCCSTHSLHFVAFPTVRESTEAYFALKVFSWPTIFPLPLLALLPMPLCCTPAVTDPSWGQLGHAGTAGMTWSGLFQHCHWMSPVRLSCKEWQQRSPIISGHAFLKAGFSFCSCSRDVSPLMYSSLSNTCPAGNLPMGAKTSDTKM